MTTASWAALVLTWIAAITIPGPDSFLLLRLGIRNRRMAVAAAFGVMTGNLAWITVSVLGITALLSAVPGLMPALQIVGSAVLVWLGVQSIRAGARGLRSPSAAEMRGETKRPFLLGLTTNLANPKVLIFFGALFTQVLPVGASWAERGAIVLTLVAIGLAWFVGFALATSSRAFQRWFSRASAWIDIVAGIVFVLVAIGILIELALQLR